MIDHKKHQLRLIDWSLAKFYHPGRDYNDLRIVTTHKKKNWNGKKIEFWLMDFCSTKLDLSGKL